MLITKTYDRARVYEYAERWANARNPLFTDYTGMGGNCTNFASQCALAGGCVMNFTPVFGWYYLSDRDRSPSWTGVRYFYDFLVGNAGEGPFGEETDAERVQIGDFIQLARKDRGFYHTLVAVGREGDDLLVAAQSDDAFRRPLSSYLFDSARFLHILGVREDVPDSESCFLPLYNGTSLPAAPESVSPLPEEVPPEMPPKTPGTEGTEVTEE